MDHPKVKEAKEKGYWLRHGVHYIKWYTPEEYQAMASNSRITIDHSLTQVLDPHAAIREARETIERLKKGPDTGKNIPEMEAKADAFERRVLEYEAFHATVPDLSRLRAIYNSEVLVNENKIDYLIDMILRAYLGREVYDIDRKAVSKKNIDKRPGSKSNNEIYYKGTLLGTTITELILEPYEHANRIIDTIVSFTPVKYGRFDSG